MFLAKPSACTLLIIFLLVRSFVSTWAGFHTEDYEFNHDHIDSLILVPKYKLAFCIIPKCGSTMMNEVMSLLSTYAETKCSVATWRWSSPECLGMDIDDVREHVYLNSSWHKAIFYRNPIVRFESAFTSKCVPGHDPPRNSVKHCMRAFGGWNITLAHAMDKLNTTKKMRDIHFIPQSDYCGNLTSYIGYYDSVMDLDRVQREEVLRLFHDRGVTAADAPKVFAILEKAFPKNNNSALPIVTAPSTVEADHHITHAATHVQNIYSHVGYRDLLLNYYKTDLDNFNITL
mmetsp:Transcript_22580/g.38232  ORF Transcript_22580/g.38232 Transcript_22580/m.38232 type:complete len:288 (+) Transcript_22580:134-997(+)